MMHKLGSLLVLIVVSLLHNKAYSRVEVLQGERDRSRLVIDLKSDEPGQWILRAGPDPGSPTSRVQPPQPACATGTFRQGLSKIVQEKTSSPTNLELVAYNNDGKLILQQNFPGSLRPSPLKKVKGSARIYQLEVRTYFAKGQSSGQQGRLTDLTDERLRELAKFGADYLWLTGIIEHGTPKNTDPDVVKGEAGSYYAIVDKWDVAADQGDLNELDDLIARAHSYGIRILLDFVSNHTARHHETDVIGKCGQDFGKNDQPAMAFSTLNNYYYLPGQTFVPPLQTSTSGRDGVFDIDLKTSGIQTEWPAKATGNDVFVATPSQDDWYETAKLNYGWDYQRKQGFYTPIPATWQQMVDVGKYWLAKGVDGFRVDFAHSVPIEFWRYFVKELRQDFPESFLVAEAYESDLRMKLPGFSYNNLLAAGFDSVYESSTYWKMRAVAERPWTMNQTGLPGSSLTFEPVMQQKGSMLTRYMENHDEIRVASKFFSPNLDRSQRSQLGWAMTAYLALLPGHLLIHGGQEFGEDAAITGSFAGDNGRTSIFDFVYQERVKNWFQGQRTEDQQKLWQQYTTLLKLKAQAPFNLPDQTNQRTFVDLMGINLNRFQSQWISAYVRFAGSKRFLVITNTDPNQDREATIHFTRENDRDSDGILKILGITNNGTRFLFKDQLFRPGWEPSSPGGSSGPGIPGRVLFQAGGIPSGLYLGQVPKGSTMVLEVTEAN